MPLVSRQRHNLSIAIALIALSAMASTCAPSKPFNDYDPPPTFAFYYTASYEIRAQYLSASLDGDYRADYLSHQFIPTGYTYTFQRTATLGTWHTIEGGRWPAQWRIRSVLGCGVGTYDDINITGKMFSLACVPALRVPSVSPSGYQGSAPPPYLTVSFNPSEVSPWTTVDVWIVDPDSELVISETPGVLDGNSSIQVPAPVLSEGQYYVLVDIDDPGEEGAAAILDVWSGQSAGSISLRASNGQWMVAEGGGGGSVNANRDAVGAWETFEIQDFNGGELWDGDEVALRTSAGWYLQAEGGGGGGFSAGGGGAGPWETFTIVLLNGSDGRVDDGESIALRSTYGYYVVSAGGGGSIVNCDRTGIGSWESWQIWLR